MTVGLDPEWIGAAVQREDRVPDGVEFVDFIGTGQMSRNVRFALTWADGEGPASVVVKIPSAEEGTRAVSFEHSVYRKECEFYRSVASRVDVCAPRAYAVHFDQQGLDFAIVLEDLAGSEQGDQFSEPTIEQLRLGVAQAAALQAPVWGATADAAFDTYRDNSDEGVSRLSAMLPIFLAVVFERLGADLDPEVTALLERFEELAPALVRARSVPNTLVHGDFRPDNFMFGRDPAAPPLAVVDWQTLHLGLGVTDIAYLLGAAVTPERRREIEHDMLDRYRAELHQRGVEYAQQQCWSDYAVGSLHGVLVALTATTMADQTERGDALFTLMLNRHGRHALDLGIVDRLTQ